MRFQIKVVTCDKNKEHMEILHSALNQSTYETDYETERGKPMPSKNHARLQTRFGRALLNKYETIFDIETEMSLELTSGKATPDVAISPFTEDDWFNDEIKVKVAPLSVIEIVSPTQSIDEIKDKIIKIYFAAGVKSAWIVIPTLQSIYILTPDKKVRNFTSGIVKDEAVGIELDIQSIFPNQS